MRPATSLLARHGAFAAAALAAAIVPLASSCAASLARVDIYDRSDQQTLDVHRHRGRQYVVGQPGNEYAIRIRNTTGGRVLAVVSVDGVNVVTGETAAPDQAGYVIEPGGYVNIQGWRKDLERTAAFYFSDPGDAYASRTGRPDDLGVIGVALFREREDHWRYSREQDAAAAPSPRQESSADRAKSNRGAAAAESTAALPALGTGHGRREHSPVQRVEFERASTRPDQRIVLRYDRRENLMAMGVLPKPGYQWREPNPFPGALGFVPDP
ncbi:MAG TPA: hypothetical protein VLH36_13580 [Steroidobacteraceae bacterium]|nr:hypothetical protein [Steroidobacteraceae bacterium]